MHDSKPSPEVAIVILNYNGIRFLREYLPSLINLNQKPYKLYVVDNASTDESLPFLKAQYPKIECIELDKNYGFAGGYNHGLQVIDAEYYFLLNSDVKIDIKDVNLLYDHIRNNPQCAAVQPKIKSMDEPEKFEYAGASGGFIDILGYPFCRGRVFQEIEVDHGQYDNSMDISWASGAAMFIKAAVYRELGGFEESYFAHQEEIDLCWRIQRAGMEIKVVPSAVAFHKGGGTLSYDNPFKTRLNFRNNLLTIIRNNSVQRLLWLLPLRLCLDGVAAILYLTQGKPRLIISILKAHAHIYAHFPMHWRARKEANRKIIQFSGGNVKPELSGFIRKSIIFQHYLLGKNTYSEIVK